MIEMITPLDQPMDSLHDMTPEEAKALEDWEDHFKVSPLSDNEPNFRQSIFLLVRWLSLARNLPANSSYIVFNPKGFKPSYASGTFLLSFDTCEILNDW
jgi:hypothetical protein